MCWWHLNHFPLTHGKKNMAEQFSECQYFFEKKDTSLYTNVPQIPKVGLMQIGG